MIGRRGGGGNFRAEGSYEEVGGGAIKGGNRGITVNVCKYPSVREGGNEIVG